MEKYKNEEEFVIIFMSDGMGEFPEKEIAFI